MRFWFSGSCEELLAGDVLDKFGQPIGALIADFPRRVVHIRAPRQPPFEIVKTEGESPRIVCSCREKNRQEHG